jgi:hypothetical protein
MLGRKVEGLIESANSCGVDFWLGQSWKYFPRNFLAKENLGGFSTSIFLRKIFHDLV